MLTLLKNNDLIQLYKIVLFFFFFFSANTTFSQIEFVENKGQWNEAVHFKGDFSSGSFFLEKQGFLGLGKLVLVRVWRG